MGEHEDTVFVTGAPGLDGLVASANIDRGSLCRDAGFDAARTVALMVFHPVHAEADVSGRAAQAILDALAERSCQVMALMPNADAGSSAIRAVLAAAAGRADLRVVTHLPRESFCSWMATCDLMIGNSSAGIIEAASFGTPVLNLGSRQNLRERNVNVVDSPLDTTSIAEAIDRLRGHGRFAAGNLYGDGQTAPRIAHHLATVPVGNDLAPKNNAY